jgi:hypothetical protein
MSSRNLIFKCLNHMFPCFDKYLFRYTRVKLHSKVLELYPFFPLFRSANETGCNSLSFVSILLLKNYYCRYSYLLFEVSLVIEPDLAHFRFYSRKNSLHLRLNHSSFWFRLELRALKTYLQNDKSFHFNCKSQYHQFLRL